MDDLLEPWNIFWIEVKGKLDSEKYVDAGGIFAFMLIICPFVTLVYFPFWVVGRLINQFAKEKQCSALTRRE